MQARQWPKWMISFLLYSKKLYHCILYSNFYYFLAVRELREMKSAPHCTIGRKKVNIFVGNLVWNVPVNNWTVGRSRHVQYLLVYAFLNNIERSVLQIQVHCLFQHIRISTFLLCRLFYILDLYTYCWW